MKIEWLKVNIDVNWSPVNFLVIDIQNLTFTHYENVNIAENFS